MTMLDRLPSPRRADGCKTGAGTVSGALVVLTLPILSDGRRYGEPHLGSGPSSRRPVPPIEFSGAAHPEPRLVHRLDRETSGLVLIAKNADAARELGKIWETRAVQKEYLAIVHGHVAAEHGIIDAPLGRDEASIVAIKDCVRPDGTPAQTEFFVEKRFSRPNAAAFSLLRLHPQTGRKHQIRIHLAHIGHPIVGDKIYGGDPDLYLALVERRLTEEQRRRLLLPQHALHAGRLQFEWRGQNYDFTTPPEPFFLQFVAGGKAAPAV